MQKPIQKQKEKGDSNKYHNHQKKFKHQTKESRLPTYSSSTGLGYVQQITEEVKQILLIQQELEARQIQLNAKINITSLKELNKGHEKRLHNPTGKSFKPVEGISDFLHLFEDNGVMVY